MSANMNTHLLRRHLFLGLRNDQCFESPSVVIPRTISGHHLWDWLRKHLFYDYSPCIPGKIHIVHRYSQYLQCQTVHISFISMHCYLVHNLLVKFGVQSEFADLWLLQGAEFSANYERYTRRDDQNVTAYAWQLRICSIRTELHYLQQIEMHTTNCELLVSQNYLI